MKRKHFKGMTGLISSIRIGCAASIGMMTSQTQAGTTEPAPAAEEPEIAANWVDFTVGGAFTGGDQAAYQRRVGQDGDFYGGISDMHWEQEANDITWTFDGHAMFGNEDYEAIVNASKEGLGYLEVGFNQFRTWYDGSGGYVPITNGWFDVDDDLHLDRGEVWFEAGLRKEDFPEITFRYVHDWRDGEKDSTSWGGTVDLYPGITGTQSYKIAPSLNQIDEETDTFSLDVAHTLGNTDFDLGLRYQSVSNEGARTMGSGVSSTNPGSGNTVKDSSEYDLDLFNAHLSSESRFGERVLASFGYSYTNLDTDIGGDRPSRDNTTGFLETGADHASWGLSGGSQATIHVLNANLWWNPVDDFVVVPSIRAEFWDQNSEGWHLAGVNARDGGGDIPGAQADQAVENALNGIWPSSTSGYYGWLEEVRDSSGQQWEEFTEALEFRYNGLENMLLYANAEWTQSEGDYFRKTITDFHNGTGVEESHRRTDSDLDIQKYTIGANWYPVRGLSFSAQAYSRSYDQDLDFDLQDDDAQISQHNNETTDFNLRMTWRALPSLTFVTRYDYQQSEIENRGVNNLGNDLGLIQSADIESNIISQSVTWLPFAQMYVQGMVSYVMSETDTPADKYAPQRMEDSDNDYLMGNLTVGYALDQKTDITAGYSFYYCENYDIPYATVGTMNGNPGSVGYGTDLEEHVFSVRLNRWINPNMVWNVGYGYYNSNDGTFGGNNSFDAHMLSTGLQVRF
ncbi:MAG: hypothetical protein EHM17_08490 [Verrucomicrobiaceae bacterium]|nr:MAG: hypothetical protein EHM17_08490 [Verrucomicrobiaceae bacterium]